MFATVGCDGMSLRTLNRELGVSHNRIHQRLGSKGGAVAGGRRLRLRSPDTAHAGSVRPDPSEPLEQLRLAIRRFVVFSADHPELVALMNIEGRQDTDRLSYIYDTYIEVALKDVARLLVHLAEEGVIRPIPLRTFRFLLAHGATAPHALVPLATKFDATSPSEPAAVEEHARLVSTILVEGLRLAPAR
jgi:TetR/AcrR family transcriptional regulator